MSPSRQQLNHVSIQVSDSNCHPPKKRPAKDNFQGSDFLDVSPGFLPKNTKRVKFPLVGFRDPSRHVFGTCCKDTHTHRQKKSHWNPDPVFGSVFLGGFLSVQARDRWRFLKDFWNFHPEIPRGFMIQFDEHMYIFKLG